jgi:cell division ATPase FtsA
LEGLEDMIKRTLTSNVRTAASSGFMQIPAGLQQPSYATGFGLLIWGAQQRSVSVSLNGAASSNGYSNGSKTRADTREAVTSGAGKSRFFNPFRRGR